MLPDGTSSPPPETCAGGCPWSRTLKSTWIPIYLLSAVRGTHRPHTPTHTPTHSPTHTPTLISRRAGGPSPPPPPTCTPFSCWSFNEERGAHGRSMISVSRGVCVCVCGFRGLIPQTCSGMRSICVELRVHRRPSRVPLSWGVFERLLLPPDDPAGPFHRPPPQLLLTQKLFIAKTKEDKSLGHLFLRETENIY